MAVPGVTGPHPPSCQSWTSDGGDYNVRDQVSIRGKGHSQLNNSHGSLATSKTSAHPSHKVPPFQGELTEGDGASGQGLASRWPALSSVLRCLGDITD